MHSTQGPSGQWYAHNGDFSGEVKLSVPIQPQARYPDLRVVASPPHQIAGQEGTFVEVEIPFEDIRALYLSYLRREQISWLEQASDKELEARLLGIPEALTPAQGAVVVAPSSEESGWVLEEQGLRRTFPPAGKLVIGGIYVHGNGISALARIDKLPDSGAVEYSVWQVGYDQWQEGAGLATHEAFRRIYPHIYTGADPVAR